VTIVCAPPSGSTFAVGTNTVVCAANDAAGNTNRCSFNVVVLDLEPPSITGVSNTPTVLWPPNHKMRDVTVSYTATDNCGPPTCSLSVESNEPENGTGDGDTAPDGEIVDAHHVRLRAERAATGNGRIYTLTITCTDVWGNSTSSTITVVVAHDIKSPVSGAAFKINTAL
jgi:HYR domain-containing protein